MASPRRLGLPLLLLGLLLTVAAFQGLLAPEADFYTPRAVSLDPGTVSASEGHAYNAPVDWPGVAGSDGEQVSPLVLVEDGVELTRQDNHAEIRARGEGRYSHWGRTIWFSASDNSDPRSNGRTYELVHPRAEVSPILGALPLLFGAGAVLALIGLLLRPRIVPALLTATTLGALAWQLRVEPLASLDLAVGAARELAASQQLHAPRDVARTGNVTWLAEQARFEGAREPAPASPPLALEVAIEGPAVDGAVRLGQDGGRVVGSTGRHLSAARLAEILVRGRVLQGERLMVTVARTGQPLVEHSFEVPVQAGPDEQVLRIVRPLGVYNGGGGSRVVSVTLDAPQGHAVLAAIDDISLVDAHDRYRSLGAGREAFQVGRSTRPALWQALPGRHVLPLDDAPGALLKLALSLRAPGGSADVAVQALDANGVATPLHTASVPAGNSWHELRIELAGPRPAALALDCDALPEGAVLAWAGVRIVDTSRPPQRVFVTLMDTLRADMLGPYADDAPATPHIDALAADGVVFDHCVSQCYWTRPSMVSIMAARYVQASGVTTPRHRLPATYPTLVEAFRQAGFYTAGTISNSNAASDAGLDRGWSEVTEQWTTPETNEAADYIGQLVEPRLDGLLEEDLFLYVHLMDAHGVYGPIEKPEDWTPPPGNPVPFDPTLDRAWLEQPTDAARIALYRSDVERLDAGWGDFLERTLQRWETDGTPSTIVAVLSDHGEYLGEHGQWGHDYFGVYPEVVDVPFILRAPDRLPRGARVGGVVQNVDVGPTLLELAGVAPPVASGWDGRSLVDVIHGGDVPTLALTSGGPTAALFGVFSEHAALVGRDDTLRTLVHGDGRAQAWPDIDDPSLIGAWLQPRVEKDFLEAWRVYRSSGDAVRDELWSDVDETASVVDPDAIRHLQEMGYLER